MQNLVNFNHVVAVMEPSLADFDEFCLADIDREIAQWLEAVRHIISSSQQREPISSKDDWQGCARLVVWKRPQE
ncbi:MAG: hypothetical protein SFV17_17035 [Candidatus Obscuribacter sp.]|nr:hypothetical protein [Candidatus Melainabacteria bacterium]MDX1988394.1 hypothetical protein [Candidatus Obscuribacter sp.]